VRKLIIANTRNLVACAVISTFAGFATPAGGVAIAHGHNVQVAQRSVHQLDSAALAIAEADFADMNKVRGWFSDGAWQKLKSQVIPAIIQHMYLKYSQGVSQFDEDPMLMYSDFQLGISHAVDKNPTAGQLAVLQTSAGASVAIGRGNAWVEIGLAQFNAGNNGLVSYPEATFMRDLAFATVSLPLAELCAKGGWNWNPTSPTTACNRAWNQLRKSNISTMHAFNSKFNSSTCVSTPARPECGWLSQIYAYETQAAPLQPLPGSAAAGIIASSTSSDWTPNVDPISAAVTFANSLNQ